MLIVVGYKKYKFYDKVFKNHTYMIKGSYTSSYLRCTHLSLLKVKSFEQFNKQALKYWCLKVRFRINSLLGMGWSAITYKHKKLYTDFFHNCFGNAISGISIAKYNGETVNLCKG